MKVLIVTPDLRLNGGVATFYRILQDHMKSCADYFTIGRRVTDEPIWQKVCRPLRDYLHFYRVLRAEEPDIVHVNPSLGSRALVRDGFLLVIAKMLGKKVLVFNHGWNLGYENVIRERYLWLFRKVFFRADAFIVLANCFRNHLADMGYEGPIYVETTAVDDSFSSECYRSSNGRKKTGDPFRILFLARIEKAKGIYEALDAYRIVKMGNPQATLTIAGDGSELEGSRAYVLARKIPDVTFAGYVQGEAKRAIYESADCYLFPSHSEGMPLTVLEAMVAGLPIVTTSVGAMPDFFENGKMGYMSDSPSPAVLADLLRQLMNDPVGSQARGLYNREYARRRFLSSSVAARLKAIYQDLLEK